MFMQDEAAMRRALGVCRAGVMAGQSPFGACIVRAGEVLGEAHNHVWLESDPTAHAEVCAIRAACQRLGQVHLPGATIYSTTEPCPMCFTAIHWARIDRIVFAASVADAAAFGFNELRIGNAELKATGGTAVTLTPGVLREEAVALFQLWQERGGRAY